MTDEVAFFILQVSSCDGDLALAIDSHVDEALDRRMVCLLCGVQLPSAGEMLQHNCVDAGSSEDGMPLRGGFGDCGCDGHGPVDGLGTSASYTILEVHGEQMDVMDRSAGVATDAEVVYGSDMEETEILDGCSDGAADSQTLDTTFAATTPVADRIPERLQKAG